MLQEQVSYALSLYLFHKYIDHSVYIVEDCRLSVCQAVIEGGGELSILWNYTLQHLLMHGLLFSFFCR